MKTFVDTSAFYAILDKSDVNHSKAAEVWKGLLEKDDLLITTNYIIVECFALMQNRLGKSATRLFQEDILPLVSIQWVGQNDHSLGVSAFLTVNRRKLSLVDSFHTPFSSQRSSVNGQCDCGLLSAVSRHLVHGPPSSLPRSPIIGHPLFKSVSRGLRSSVSARSFYRPSSAAYGLLSRVHPSAVLGHRSAVFLQRSAVTSFAVGRLPSAVIL